MTRRQLLAAGAVGAALLTLPGTSWALDDSAAQSHDLPVGTRSTKLLTWAPAIPKGVILFSHGHGSWPERYTALMQKLVADGWAIAAPVHVDSMHYPDRDKFTMQASFGERIADMGATSAWTAKAWPGLPVVAAGHSFGTLVALCLGGGLAYIGPFRNPAVKAVLGFSTPGKIPGLVQPIAYTSVAVPVFIVTGTADTVPGFVTDPADHLFAAETAPTGYALVIDGAAHDLVAGTAPAFVPAAALAIDFLDGTARGDAAAARRFEAFKAPGGARFIAHKARP